MGLREYHRKRDFTRTREPRGKVVGPAPERGRARAPRFVIQKHAASRLHYDFRLEHDGVLKSWAVPKGPSLDPAEKRLAVEVEDHPIEYGRFEGTIPQGEYGGGTVMLWDRGTWAPRGDVAAGLRAGKLEFELDGEKLQGGWKLVRMGGREGDPRNWLLIKTRDEHVRSGAANEATERLPKSVATGRTLEEIAGAKRGRVWSSNRGGGARTATRKRGSPPAAKRAAAVAAVPKGRARGRGAPRRAARSRPEDLEGARPAALPRALEPELATLVGDVPDGPEWLHEIKFDGYRMLARIADGPGGRKDVRWFSRRGNDWSERFRRLSPSLARLPLREAWIDGEVVVVAPDGTTDFQRLQNALKAGSDVPLVYYAFDLLHLDGHDLRGVALERRKELLAGILRGAPADVRPSEHVVGSGARFHAAACRHRLEGVVSKLRAAPYRSGRQRDWLKIKCGARQELVVGGWSDPQGSRSGLGSLLLGHHDREGRLVYAGRVGTGFTDASLRELRAKLDRRARATCPFAEPPPRAIARAAHWVEPELVVEVEFTGWTSDGRLRHPSFEGLREDKDAREIVREVPQPTPRVAAARARGTARRAASTAARTAAKPAARTVRASRTRASPSDPVEVAGIRLTHPDRVLWPASGTTKLELARYWERIAPRALPHVAGRPISFVRCPDGVGGECFFQRHPSAAWPDAVKSVRDPESGRTYVWIDSVAGLVALAQMSVLEVHPWGTRVDALDRPDRITFDLDPDPSVPWTRVVEAAFLVRDALAELDLESHLKTTGGKGLHVVVPIARRNTWEEVKAFSGGIARRIAAAAPERYVASAPKAARKGRVFVDWLRNARSATAVAAWSPRARAEPTISRPLAWRELGPKLDPAAFTLSGVAARTRDPWPDLARVRQSLTRAMLAAAGAR